MRRRLLVAVLVGVALCTAAPARAASITFDSFSVAPGAEFKLEIRAVDITDLFTFGFDLAFNPARLEALSIDEGDFLSTAVKDPLDGGTFFIPGAILPGLISLNLSSLFGVDFGASGSGVLAVITFRAVAGGDGELGLQNVFLVDSAFPMGNPIDADVNNGLVTVDSPTPIPEPSTLGLLGLGLAALARRLRRKTPVAR